MSVQLTIEVKVPNTALLTGAGQEIAAQELRAAAEESLALLRDEIVIGTPVNTGALRHGTQTSLVGTGVDLTGRVFNPLAHAHPVEHGRRPGRFPPLAPLELWVRRKLGVAESESHSVAFLVARKIARVGTKGAHMFRNAVAAKRDAVRDRFRDALANIKTRLSQ